MIPITPARRRMARGGAALIVAIALSATPALFGDPVAAGADGALTALREAPPPCMGYTIDDPCITPQALAECRRAVKKCGDEPVAVILTCPLQFSCGR